MRGNHVHFFSLCVVNPLLGTVLHTPYGSEVETRNKRDLNAVSCSESVTAIERFTFTVERSLGTVRRFQSKHVSFQ